MSIFKNIKSSINKAKRTKDAIAKWIAFGNNIKPIDDFGKLPTPDAPDYNDLAFWAAHPDKESKASFTPEGNYTNNQATAKADVFFVHPTTYFGSNHWNAPFDHIPSK